MSDRPVSRVRRPLLPPRQAVRLAVGLYLALGVVTWNAIFDRVIVMAGRDYLYRQAQSQRHQGPKVTIAEVMRPAARHGVVVASAWSLLVTAVGLAAVRCAAPRLDGKDDVPGHRSRARGPSPESDRQPPEPTSATLPS